MAKHSVCLFCSAVEDLPAGGAQPRRRVRRGVRGARIAPGIRRQRPGADGHRCACRRRRGRRSLGIMPRHLIRPEHAADNIGNPADRDSLAERKQRMAEASDLFVALPGGIGTLNELIEMLTLNDLGLQDKAVILCAQDDFWRPFVAMIERFPRLRRAAPQRRPDAAGAASVGEVMRLIDAHFLPQAAGADPG